MARGKTVKAQAKDAIGNKFAPARFVLFLVLLPVAYFAYHALFPGGTWQDAVAIAFDFAAAVFLVSIWPILRNDDVARIREHAARNDANRVLILVFTSLLTVIVMVAISGEMQGASKGELTSIVKLIATLLLIWLFANVVYTMHYAHAFYTADTDSGGDIGGIEFPGTKTPNYFDFAYFAFTLGMTFQTSDTDITASPIRRIALLHSFAAFVFNIGVIAFTINVLGGSSG